MHARQLCRCRRRRSLLLLRERCFTLLVVSFFAVLGPRDEFDALLLLQLIIIMLVGLFALVIAASCRFCHRSLLMVLVEEVTFEHGLCRRIFQVDLVFLHGLGVFPLLIVNVVLVKIVIVLAW